MVGTLSWLRWLVITGIIVILGAWVITWRAPTPQIRTSARQIDYSPNGQFLAAAVGQGVEIWAVPQRQLIQTLSSRSRGSSGAFVVAWSPDNQLIATPSSNDSLEIWQVHGALRVQQLTGHTHAITAVAFSPDGSFVAAAGDDATVLVWEVQTGQLVQRFKHRTEYVSSIAFTPDGQWLVSGASGVYMWRMHAETDKADQLRLADGETPSLL